MRAFCQRCRAPRHIVGGRAVARSENRVSEGGATFVETVRQIVEGRCEACGSTLHRLNPVARGRPRESTTLSAVVGGDAPALAPS
jgi:hypothetical protein